MLGRSLPPAAAPLGFRELLSGMVGIFRGQRDIDRFREELKDHFGVKHCFLVSSGQVALSLTLQALKALNPERDEVIIPAFTCYSVPAAVLRAGLRVRLCDLGPETLDFDFDQLSAILAAAADEYTETIEPQVAPTGGRSDESRAKERAHNRVLAVVPTHLFGIPSDIGRVRSLLPGHGVAILEDAAQAMGETGSTGKLGVQGDVGFFSLGRGKALSTVEGGIIVTNREDIAELISGYVDGLARYNLVQLCSLVLKSFVLSLLTHPRLFCIPQSLPFLKLGQTFYDPDFSMNRMTSFQAGLTRGWRSRLSKMRDIRKRNVASWIESAEESEKRIFGPRGSSLPGMLRFPLVITDSEKRRDLLHESGSLGLGVMPSYPTSINRIPDLEIAGQFPVAERLAGQLVTLPTHSYVRREDVLAISELLSRALQD
jgi:perosamine synthetase